MILGVLESWGVGLKFPKSFQKVRAQNIKKNAIFGGVFDFRNLEKSWTKKCWFFSSKLLNATTFLLEGVRSSPLDMF